MDPRGRAVFGAVLAVVGAACGGGDPASPEPQVSPRTYVMGFSPIPPRFDAALVQSTLDVWARRSDAGLVLQEPPWTELLAGVDPEALVRANPLGIAALFRAKGLHVLASIDPTNGLDRASEGSALVAAGRSLSEPEVRALYRRYVGAFVALVRPEVLSVASETNLVRAVAPPHVYAGLMAAANEAAEEARGRDPTLRLMITIQVEIAYGGRPGEGSPSLARDRTDFPFAQAIGLSSFPFLSGVADPDQLPLDYYARLVSGAGAVPLYLIEGGWPSDPAFASSLDEQRRYIERQVRMLDEAQARGWFQLTFTDLDPSAFGPGIEPFASLGLADVNLQPKLALQPWDAAFARPLR